MGKHNLHYALLPRVSISWRRSFRKADWAQIDLQLKKELGITGYAIPSVRVGFSWILEYLGYSRIQNHVLVPQFLSRCIHNVINRHALPVERLTSQTTAVLSVEQFGFRQDDMAIAKEVSSRKLVCIEDNASSIGYSEKASGGSLARLIGFSKVLPILKGGCLISEDKALLEFIRRKREQKNCGLCSWFIAASLVVLRGKRGVVENSTLADLAYEAYLASPSDNRILLNNFRLGIAEVKKISNLVKKRFALVKSVLAGRALYPESDRLAQVLLLPARHNQASLQEAFARNHFDSTLYHFDVNRNVFNQRFEKCLLIPLNPDISQGSFENLINQIGKI